VAAGAVRAGHEVTIVTARHNAAAIESTLAYDPETSEHLTPLYVGFPDRIHSVWHRLGRPGRQLYYLACQWSIWRAVARRHREQPFQLAHHVTIAADWMPCGASFVHRLPLVWGPVGGVQKIPPLCRPWLGWRGRMTELCRSILVTPLRRIGGRRTAARAALIVTQNRDVERYWSKLGPPCVMRPNVFLDDPEPAVDADVSLIRSGSHSRFHAVFVGRLLAWKGVHLAVATMAEPSAQNWDLHFFGDGPERRRLRRRVDRLGLTDRVHFHGQVARSDVRRSIAEADALLYPSMRDSAPWAVGEALFAGCPVVCLGAGGAATLVEDGGGTAVSVTGGLTTELAATLTNTEGARRESVRWSASDLDSLLPEWYELAVPGTRTAE
jgi:glycosyltransferase involved in cell wall biosynthesis